MVVRKMKEKCKDAARMRREKERAEFEDLSKLLPLPSSITSQLDKASIIRLTSSYLRMRAAFPDGLGENWGYNMRVASSASSAPVFQLANNSANNRLLVGHQHQPLGATSLNYRHTHSDLIQQQQQPPPPPPPPPPPVRELGSLILQTLDGFVFALHKDGKIMYISETASVHLGLPQIDLTGSSLFDYVHPSDQNDVYTILNLSDADRAELNLRHSLFGGDHFELGRSFCMRMKCILPRRNAGLVCDGYKAIHCSGYLKVRCKSPSSSGATIEQTPGAGDQFSLAGTTKIRPTTKSRQQQVPVTCDKLDKEWESYALVAVGHSLLPTASTEVKLGISSFMFRANLDLKLYYVEAPAMRLLGYEQMEMIGHSLYQFVHLADLGALEHAHKLLLEKGQVVTRYYRLMRRDGGSVWLQTYATLINNPRSMPKPQHIPSLTTPPADLLANRTSTARASPIVSKDLHHQWAGAIGATNRPAQAAPSPTKRPRERYAPITKGKLTNGRTTQQAQLKVISNYLARPMVHHLDQPTSAKKSDSSPIEHCQGDCMSPLQGALLIGQPQATTHQDATNNNYNNYYQYQSIGCTRRPSDDTSSIVSSIASTSHSSSGASSSSTLQTPDLLQVNSCYVTTTPTTIAHDNTKTGGYLMEIQARLPPLPDEIMMDQQQPASKVDLLHADCQLPLSELPACQPAPWLASSVGGGAVGTHQLPSDEPLTDQTSSSNGSTNVDVASGPFKRPINDLNGPHLTVDTHQHHLSSYFHSPTGMVLATTTTPTTTATITSWRPEPNGYHQTAQDTSTAPLQSDAAYYHRLDENPIDDYHHHHHHYDTSALITQYNDTNAHYLASKGESTFHYYHHQTACLSNGYTM